VFAEASADNAPCSDPEHLRCKAGPQLCPAGFQHLHRTTYFDAANTPRVTEAMSWTTKATCG